MRPRPEGADSSGRGGCLGVGRDGGDAALGPKTPGDGHAVRSEGRGEGGRNQGGTRSDPSDRDQKGGAWSRGCLSGRRET